jgi:soluble lytic murein transglycosylase-like protein
LGLLFLSNKSKTETKIETKPKIKKQLKQKSKNLKDEILFKINTISQKAGIDPLLISKIIRIESNFQTNIRPIGKSSAYGLGQFINSTWIYMVKKYGKKYGIESSGENGEITKQDALDNRNNIDLQIAMTAEYAKYGLALSRKIRSNNTYSEDANVYAHHNLGPSGAVRFLKKLTEDVNTPIEDVITQKAINNNPSLYRNGQTIGEAYQVLVRKMQGK